MSRPQCMAWGATAVVLLVSRAAGVAPLRLRRRPDGWLVTVSPYVYVYDVILFSFIVSVGVAGLILDLNAEPSRAVRMRTPTKRILWIADFGVVLLTALVGAYEGPFRMNSMIRYLNELQKINTIINIQSSASTEKKRTIVLVSIMFGFLLVTVLDIWTIMVDVIRYGRDRFIACLYMSFGYSYMAMIFLKSQFVVGALAVHSTLKNLNDVLETETIIQGAAFGINDNFAMNKKNRIYPSNISTNVNCISYSDYLKSHPNKKSHETVRRLALSFSNICYVVTSVTKCHENSLLLLIATFAIHLVIIPYYISLALQYSESQVEAVLLLLLWYGTHLMSLALLVEPCHWTLEELNRTHVLVSILTDSVSADELLSKELNEFFKHLALNKITFSPLGICTLARPLCATIMGILTTYLVIIFQFQTSADKADGF
ncbi:uncharacterized protein LOC113509288 [Galleria mellonella]|uniref:Gustatory receptor n=1 Tax=Galleria mellonella TaxID=7137 RepID=A0ABM3MKZ8_GALME|nr:uncharacterized protein LOC113509288 [Galleria mellonella]